MTRDEYSKIKNESIRAYNEFNHLFMPNQKHSSLYGYFNECPIYLIYDYTNSLYKKYKCEFRNTFKDAIDKFENRVGANLSDFHRKAPDIGCVYYNRFYQEYYIIINKAFINCAGKYKHVVYNKILFHEIGHVFNKDNGRVYVRYWQGKKYVKRSKERRADLTGKTLSYMFGVDTTFDTVYPHILKRTMNTYARKCGKKRLWLKSNLYLVKRIKLLYC